MVCLVQFFLWQPNCFSYRRPLESRWLWTLLYTILSETFENTGENKNGCGTAIASVALSPDLNVRTEYHE